MYNEDGNYNSPFPMPLSPQMDPYANAMYPGIMAPPTPATNYQFAPQMQPSYARGGAVQKMGLKEIADMLRQTGERQDKTLAYLTPAGGSKIREKIWI